MDIASVSWSDFHTYAHTHLYTNAYQCTLKGNETLKSNEIFHIAQRKHQPKVVLMWLPPQQATAKLYYNMQLQLLLLMLQLSPCLTDGSLKSAAANNSPGNCCGKVFRCNETENKNEHKSKNASNIFEINNNTSETVNYNNNLVQPLKQPWQQQKLITRHHSNKTSQTQL